VTTSSFLKLSGNIRIGELLVQAGMLTQAQLQEATRHAGAKRLQIGQILVMYGYLTAKDLQSALAAQSMVRDRSLDLNQALRSLKIAYKTASRFEDVVSNQSFAGSLKLPTGKLGELLLDAGVINSDQFFKAMDKSMTTGVPLGRTLVFEKLISDELLSAALDAQVRLRDQMLTREESIQSVQIAAGIPLSEGSRSASQPAVTPVGRLGELLVMANVLTATTVLDSLEWALVNQQPIGQVFLSQGLVNQELLDTALVLQRMVRETSVTVLQAAEAIKAVHQGGADAQQVIDDLKAQTVASKPTIDYMKLLTLARVVTHDDIGTAIEAGLNKPEVLGKLLVMTGFMSEPSMEATLRCLAMLSSGELNQDDAVVSLDYCLHHRQEREVSFDDALKDLGWQPQKTEEKVQEAKAEEAQAPSGAEAAAPSNVESDVIDISDLIIDIDDVEPSGDPQSVTGDLTGNLSPPPGQSKGRKFVETIAPEDPRARELATLIGLQNKSDGILEKTAKGELNSVVFDSYARLAESYIENGNNAEAQVVYERILVLRLQELGPNHPNLVGDFRNLAAVLCTQEKFDRAEPFLRRAISILETGASQPLMLADFVSFLANIYLRQSKFSETEPLLNQALEIRRKHLGPEHLEISDSLFDLARLYRKTNRTEESEQLYSRAKDILAKNHAQDQFSD